MTGESQRRIEQLKKRGKQNQLGEEQETLHGFDNDVSSTSGEVGIRF